MKHKRGTVGGEAIYFAMGIDEEGYRQILRFYVGGQESSNGWWEVLKDFYARRAQCVFDGLPGLDSAFKEMYPQADVQH